jgi:hypothetical protein
VETEKGLDVLSTRLGIDSAAAVFQEAVDHDTVEAGYAANLIGESLAKLMRGLGLLYVREHGSHERECIFGLVLARGLKLKHHGFAAPIDERVNRRRVVLADDGERMKRSHHRAFGAQHCLKASHAIRREEGDDTLADQFEGLGAKKPVGVTACLKNSQRFGIDSEQSAVGLYGTRNVNWLTVAIGEVDDEGRSFFRRTIRRSGSAGAAHSVLALSLECLPALGTRRLSRREACRRN